MVIVYKSTSTRKKIVFGSRFKDGRIRINIQDVYRENEPLYLIPEISSKKVFRLSDNVTLIYNYPKKEILRINKWPGEIFKKVNYLH